jgi:glycogen debranching enzyme
VAPKPLSIVVLKAAGRNAKFCYERAVAAAQQAASARHTFDKEFWSEREKYWIHLAASYDYQERLAAFIQELRSLPRQPICSGCDVPMRVKQLRSRRNGLLKFDYQCPACKTKQTIVEIGGFQPRS